MYPSKTEVADYLDAYASLLGPNTIRYNFAVTNADYDKSNHIWTVDAESLVTQEKVTYLVPFLVVATGENVVPKIPVFKGQELYKGKIMHSVTYKFLM